MDATTHSRRQHLARSVCIHCHFAHQKAPELTKLLTSLPRATELTQTQPHPLGEPNTTTYARTQQLEPASSCVKPAPSPTAAAPQHQAQHVATKTPWVSCPSLTLSPTTRCRTLQSQMPTSVPNSLVANSVASCCNFLLLPLLFDKGTMAAWHVQPHCKHLITPAPCCLDCVGEPSS